MVAPQAFDHTERVGRSFEELRELLVIQCESCSLRRVGTRLPCGRIGLVGGPSQNGWWGQDGHVGTFMERRMPAMPIGRLLVGIADTEHNRVVERAAKDLHPKWQAVGAKTVADLQRRLAGDIGGGEQVRPLPERQAPVRVETRRFPLARGDERIVLLVERAISATIRRCSRVACT
jgi:hypothetical protein